MVVGFIMAARKLKRPTKRPQKPSHLKRPRCHHPGRKFLENDADLQRTTRKMAKIVELVKRKAGVCLADANE